MQYIPVTVDVYCPGQVDRVVAAPIWKGASFRQQVNVVENITIPFVVRDLVDCSVHEDGFIEHLVISLLNDEQRVLYVLLLQKRVDVSEKHA